jgi:hypothetical protein
MRTRPGEHRVYCHLSPPTLSDPGGLLVMESVEPLRPRTAAFGCFVSVGGAQLCLEQPESVDHGQE